MAQLKMEVVLGLMDRATAPLRGFQGQIKNTAKALREQQKELRNLNKVKMPEAGPLTKQQMETRRQIELTTKAIDRQRNRLKYLNNIQDRRQQGGKIMRSGAMGMAKSAAMTYGVTRFLGEGFEFDETMSRVQALTRLDKNSPVLQQLREQAKFLGATTWADPTQAAQGQAFYAMAGFTPENIMKAMPGTLDLARASSLDIGRAADIGSNILQGFGLDPSQMNRAMDVLVGTFTRANVDMEMLGESMKYAAPIAKTLGISMEETSALVGMLGNVGIQGGQAGRAIKAIQQRLASPTKAGEKALAQLGIKTKDKQGNIRDIPTIFAEILEKSKKMGNADRLGILKSIAGDIAGPAFASMIDQGTLQDFSKLLEELRNNHGEAKQVALTMADNVAGDWEELTSSFTDWKITIGELNDGGIRVLLQNLNKVMDWVGKVTKESPAMMGFISKAIVGFIAMTAGIGAMTFMWGLFNKAVLGNPVVAFLVLFGILIWQIYDKWDSLVWFWKEGAGQMRQDIGNLIGNIPGVGNELRLVWDTVTGVVGAIATGFGTIGTWIKFAIDLFFDWEGSIAKIKSAWDDFCMNWKRFWGDIGAWLQPKIDAMMQMMAPLISVWEKIFGAENTPAMQGMYDQLGLANKGISMDRFRELQQPKNGDELMRIIHSPAPTVGIGTPPTSDNRSYNVNQEVNLAVYAPTGNANDIATAATDAIKNINSTPFIGDKE